LVHRIPGYVWTQSEQRCGEHDDPHVVVHCPLTGAFTGLVGLCRFNAGMVRVG
jgi:hypothetical protein